MRDAKQQERDGTGDPQSPLFRLAVSGVFDAAFYAQANPDLTAIGERALAHYHLQGWREGRKPNFYFDPAWYLAQNPDVAEREVDPLFHYVIAGEREGRRPSPVFDPVWYGEAHDVPPGELRLAHYLRHRRRGTARPFAEFDPAFYLSTYPDIEAAGIDPFEHYLVQGFREARRPFAEFDPAFYRQRYLRDRPEENPLLHYVSHKNRSGVHPNLPPGETTIARELRRRTQPGPDFEERTPVPPRAARRARVLAYYLPQFHPIPENDRWWGDGFTEWTNLARSLPRFAGHDQPRVPRDLGHYRLDAAGAPETLRRQIRFAREAGIEGFVFYYYRFDDRRLLEGPLEALLADPTLDMPFCLMWANENWTRRWDGSDDEVLIAQDPEGFDDAGFADDLARHFRDPRYIRVEGRPLFMVYRPGLVPEIEARAPLWREMVAARGVGAPLLVMAQSFGAEDPRDVGFDGAVEFPPHKLCDKLAPINAELDILDTDFHARVYDYADVVAASLAEPVPTYALIKTAVPGWDNDARRQGGGLVLHRATPAAYEAWLRDLVLRARRHTFHGEAIVCINAWNEWAEGATLEPDLHHGAAFLNATGRAITGAVRGDRLLLVGHDALRHGAQMLLLALARRLAAAHGGALEILLLGGGPLEAEYAAVAPTRVVARDDPGLGAMLDGARKRGVGAALVNSLASGRVAPLLAARDIRVVLLAHEMDGLIGEKHLVADAAAAVAAADATVVAAREVADGIAAAVPFDAARAVVLPQGIYRPVERAAERAARRPEARRALGAGERDRVVLGLGWADLRKGFDLFLALSRLASATSRLRFVWAGGIDPDLARHLAPEIAAATAAGAFRHLGFVDDPAPLLAAADCLALPSREDPFPSVALEALAAGLPVVAFENTGGMPALLRAIGGGTSVPRGDMAGYLAAVTRECGRRADDRARLARLAARRFRFDEYARRVLALLRPDRLDVSVVVPSCDYGAWMPERLGSILAQTHPVREVVVLDDASTDDSVARARATALAAGREVTIRVAARRSGSVFVQWRRALARTRGEWLWIAEADDSADPRFLAALAERLAGVEGAVLGFTDSRPVDGDGRALDASYKPYYRAQGCALLERDFVRPGPEVLAACLTDRNMLLNASAVLFRRSALRGAFERCGEDLAALRLAGDWRLYAEMLRDPASRVAYVAEPLNIHRRHAASVTHRIDTARHDAEIARVRRAVAGFTRRRAPPPLAAPGAVLPG